MDHSTPILSSQAATFTATHQQGLHTCMLRRAEMARDAKAREHGEVHGEKKRQVRKLDRGRTYAPKFPGGQPGRNETIKVSL